MAQPIYTYRLGYGGAPAAGEVVLYTGSATQHTILRDVVYTNAGGTTVNLQISIRAANAFIYPVYQQAMPAFSSGHWAGRQEIRAGEQLVASSSGGPWSAAATGYVFNQ